jgi:hypothetical protein
LNTHQHQIPETYEEALELRLEHPARFDWPAIDKYGDLSRPE